MGLEVYEELLDAHFKALFKGLADPVEQCREMAIRLSMGFFSLVPDLTPYLAYFFPVSSTSRRFAHGGALESRSA
jgi:hypothetical protein